jgi:hypothetical protein
MIHGSIITTPPLILKLSEVRTKNTIYGILNPGGSDPANCGLHQVDEPCKIRKYLIRLWK